MSPLITLYLMIAPIFLFAAFVDIDDNSELLAKHELTKYKLMITIVRALLFPIRLIIQPRVTYGHFMFGLGFLYGFIERRLFKKDDDERD